MEDTETTLLRLASNGDLTPRFTLKALCLLAEADRLGSVAADNPEMLERIELGRELCREAGCYEGPYPFASSHTRRRLFAGGAVWKDQDLYDDTWGEVVLMCGLPGTGKDTWIKANCPDLPVVSLDDLRLEMDVEPTENQGRVVQAARERAKALLREKRPFVWNATSLTSLRAQQIDLFEQYHARVRVVYLETPWEENLRRNASRPDAVPEHVIDRMLARLEPPERFEAQAVEWICV
jgi:predicted kinase